MHMYIYIYIYVYTYTHIFVYMYICIYTYMYIHMCMYTHHKISGNVNMTQRIVFRRQFEEYKHSRKAIRKQSMVRNFRHKSMRTHIIIYRHVYMYKRMNLHIRMGVLEGKDIYEYIYI